MAEGRPALAAQIHPHKNPGLDVHNVTLGSHRLVQWLCKCPTCGAPHEWSARLDSRALQGKGCPFCANQRPCRCNSLQAMQPDLAAEWHPTMNDQARSEEVLPNSTFKAWWTCKTDSAHPPWQAMVHRRADPDNPTGCPECANAAKRNKRRRGTLAQERPDLAEQWHSKNGSLTPHSITCGSNKKVWWFCPNSDCQHPHAWEAVVRDRTARHSGCPFCSGRQVCPCNSLAATHPHIAAQWHPTKNGTLTPEDIGHGSNKRVWWQNKQAVQPDGHPREWAVFIYSRCKPGKTLT